MERSLHRALWRFATLASLWAACGARAQAVEPIALQWNAPAGCPSQGQVLERIRRLSVEWPPRGTPLTAAATVDLRVDGRFRMKLVVRAGDLSGQRDLESTTCESLANAAAVHVALLLNGRDPGQVGEAATAPPRAPSRAATPRSQRDGEVGNARGAASGDAPTNPASNAPGNASNTAPANPTSSADTDPARDAADPASRGDRDSDPGVRLLLQVPRASAQLGPLPRASFGVSVAGGLMLRDWRLIAAAHVWLRQALSRDDQPTIRADVDRVSASLRLCRAATWKRFEVAPCAKVSLEHVWARGAGDDVTARTAEATWLAAGLGLQSRLYLLTWWSVVAELDLEFEAARPEISIDGFGRVGKLGLTAFTLTLGSEWIL